MKKPLDKVTDAYFNEMGEAFGEKIRNRIHWICEQAKGESILDVGCSQGITAILLGREGKQVLALDLLQESIDYANEMLDKESEVTKKYVKFMSANFMDYSFEENHKFDCIIMGEVLEHITDPQRFIKKAFLLLNEDGKIVITVPFGINDYFDHKKTYYLLDLLNLKIEGMGIEKVKFLGKWVGLIISKKVEKDIKVDEQLIQELENAFYSVERQYIVDMTNRGNTIKKLKNAIKEKEEKAADLVPLSKMKQKISEKDSEISSFRNEIETLKMKTNESFKDNQEVERLEKEISSLRKAFEDSKIDVIKVRKEKIDLQQKLVESYNKEQTLLNTYKKLLKNSNQFERKYKALSSSKLGNFTLSYWKWRKKNFGGK